LTAAEEVRQRLLRATAALEHGQVVYLVIGGNAVGSWVARIDKKAVRFTQDVDLMIRRSDLDAARTALAAGGFIYRHAAGVDMFLDGPNATARDAVHVIFSGEKVRPEYLLPTPDLSESDVDPEFRVLNLEASSG